MDSKKTDQEQTKPANTVGDNGKSNGPKSFLPAQYGKFRRAQDYQTEIVERAHIVNARSKVNERK
jgi:hypothetical protein